MPRAVEATLACLGLAVASPILLLAAAAFPRPVLFRQQRVGLNGRPFTLLKLRTMRVAWGDTPEGSQLTAAGDARITPAGRWLRRFKLDEIPQLWNVVRGDMSLVGPRPEVPRYVDDSPLWLRVLSARPGLTDPVTLRLRDEEALLAGVDDPESFYRERLLPWKLRGYADYLEHRSWATDLGVLGATALAVLRLRRTTLPEIEG
ncbi:MAG TPA: sugar transferase [Thermoanaerobaculia bacterium]|nr:sugar transferase [Thermoanaerobaculia bacterium]